METTRIKLAALWTVVMFNMTFADIIGFMNPGTLERMMNGDVGFTITPELLLLFSVLTAVPITMIFLSLVLPVRTNRWFNTLAVVLTTIWIVGGLTASLSYFFFMFVEIVSMLGVLWYAWRQLDTSVNRQSARTLKNPMS
jgi:Family of unknown function (DUF6326)